MSAPRSTRDSLTAVRVVDDDLARRALSFLRSRSVEKTPVHVLAIEHIRRVTPNFFVVVLVVLIEHTAGLPVTHDELLEDNRFHQRDIGFPFPEPLCTWNTSKRVMVGVDVENVRRSRDLPLAAHEIEAPTSTSTKPLRSKISTMESIETVRYVAHSCASRRRTKVTSATERDSSSEPANAATDDGDLELLESRG